VAAQTLEEAGRHGREMRDHVRDAWTDVGGPDLAESSHLGGSPALSRYVRWRDSAQWPTSLRTFESKGGSLAFDDDLHKTGTHGIQAAVR